MRIGVLSYNVAELAESPHLADPGVLALNPDIYVEMTQEDYRKPDGTPLLDSTILESNGYNNIVSVSLNGTRTTKNLILNLYAKTDAGITIVDKGVKAVSPKEEHKSLSLAAQLVAKKLHTGFGFTKGVVYIKIMAKRPILFMNMHLPVDTTEKDGKLVNASMGLEYRKTVFLKLLDKLVRRGVLDDNTILFVGGDLNFRMDFRGMNQLNQFLASDAVSLHRLRELPFPNNTKHLTCKFNGRNRNCRTQKMPQKNVGAFLNNVQKTCGNPKRTPSRCDRFLISTAPGDKVKVLLHTVKYLLPESDHNGLLTCFDITRKETLEV
jgi:hypothetical protein